MNTTTTALREIDPRTVQTWLDEEKAVLIDIREPDEYAREHIFGARLVPLSSFDAKDFSRDHGKIAVFHCGTGVRTYNAAQQILGAGFAEIYHLEDGLTGWKKAGLPVHLNRKAPISIMRQVQLVVGAMVVIGVVLGLTLNPWFTLLSAFFGAGLFFAGATGTCALASLLSRLPYNQQPVTGS